MALLRELGSRHNKLGDLWGAQAEVTLYTTASLRPFGKHVSVTA